MLRIILSLWLAITPAYAGQSGLLLGVSAPGAGLDPATTAWVNQVVTNGGSVSAGRKTIVNTFIVCMKTASLWSTLDRYWLLAGEDQPSGLTDMVNLQSATNNSSTFTASQGFAGTGSSFVNTNYVPSTSAINYALTNATMGGQIQTNRTVGATGIAFGGADPSFTDIAVFSPLNAAGNTEIFLNSSSSVATPGTTTKGSWVATRSSTNALYQNAVSFESITQTPNAVPTGALYIGAGNQGGSPVANSTDLISSFFVGSGWSSSQVSSFESCQNAMMTSIGINVH